MKHVLWSASSFTESLLDKTKDRVAPPASATTKGVNTDLRRGEAKFGLCCDQSEREKRGAEVVPVRRLAFEIDDTARFEKVCTQRCIVAKSQMLRP